MSKLREAGRRVLAEIRGQGCFNRSQEEALDALRAALAEPDTTELERAVVDAASRARRVDERSVPMNDSEYTSSLIKLWVAVDALNALNAARRPRYEARNINGWWEAAVWRGSMRLDVSHAAAAFRGPDAERHAKEWAAARDAEPRRARTARRSEGGSDAS